MFLFQADMRKDPVGSCKNQYKGIKKYTSLRYLMRTRRDGAAVIHNSQSDVCLGLSTPKWYALAQ